MDTYRYGPSAQSVLASLLWTLGSLPRVPACQRQRAIVIHQLRYIQGHPDTEALMQDVVGQLLVQLEDEAVHRHRADAVHGGPAGRLGH